MKLSYLNSSRVCKLCLGMGKTNHRRHCNLKFKLRTVRYMDRIYSSISLLIKMNLRLLLSPTETGSCSRF